MLNQSIHDRYFSILKSYITRPEEEHLSAAMELGRELVMEDIPPEEIAELHDVALRRLAQEFPDRTLLDVAHLTTSPLMEILMAYGLVHRDRNEHNIRMEKALHDREERYRKLFEEAPVMYLITHDKDGVPTVADCNKRFLNTLGYTRTEVQGKPLADFYTPASRAELLEGGGYKRALEGSFIAEECQLTASDGRVIETLLRAVPETYSDGNVRGSLAMYVDVTKQKRAEEALKKSEGFLRNVLDGLGPFMLVGLMTSEGTLIEANRPALEVAGLRPQDVLGKPFEETYWWSYSKPVKQQLREAIQRAAGGETCRYDVDVRIGENSFITIDFCIQPLVDEAGRIIYLIPSAVDITERKQAEEVLKRKEHESALLAEAGRIFNSSLEIKKVFDEVAKLVSEEIGETCAIFKVEGEHILPITAFRKGEEDKNRLQILTNNPIPLQGSVTGSCVENKEPVLIPDVVREQTLIKSHIQLLNVRSYICIR